MKKIFGLLLAAMLVGPFAMAEQSTGEKVNAKTNDAVRGTKKGAHRVEEGIDCAQGDAKCAKTKAKNRTKEAKDYTKDKSKEAVDKVD